MQSSDLYIMFVWQTAIARLIVAFFFLRRFKDFLTQKKFRKYLDRQRSSITKEHL